MKKPVIPSSQDVMTALLAALITVSITAILLRFQTDADLNREKNDLLFKEKYQTYNNFLVQFSHVLSLKDQLDQDSLIQLESALYQTLLFINDSANFDLIYQVVTDYIDNGQVHNLAPLVAAIRAELQPDSQVDQLDNPQVEEKIDRLFTSVKAKRTSLDTKHRS